MKHLYLKLKIQTSKLSLLCLFVVFCSLSAFSQTYNHASVWSRLLVSKQFGKWTVSGDVAYRRQNDFRYSKYNFLAKPLLDAQRITVGYRTKSWLFNVAISRWHAYQILGKEADFVKLPTIEWRFTPGIEYFKNFNKSTFQWRTQYEYRSFVDRTAGRFRQRLQFRQPISKTNSLVFLQEALFGAPPNSTKKYEQNQLGVTFNHNFTKHLESELGYRYIFRRRRTSDEIDNENAVVVGLMYRL
ncbi:Protein of unknown function DUF2490 [Emticicia oligotrophica DSM 17448]|uniref:DUF2490 domain-containing protein n=1 Tax=Emticicia oligotrophica (strain DSM 17448 / CIP 109782 / MTCC 6937 / GPTSA100-15) TaxID=929562 RepID=A0ABM5MZG0_EMTOG|nr:DUF2490 domain-containing protein [Emticicia oligotrophica]AFK02541.1 Protein of unknown function DUF2490 [Emticicia oligotrophica DSM 17448]